MLKRTDLTDPDSAKADHVVIYDGQCNFCRGQVQRLARLDLAGRLGFLSLHDSRAAERYPDLSHEDLMQQMYVVSPDGRRRGGSDAIRYLSRKLPLLWPVMPLLHLPGTAPLWRWMYQQVAKRRYKIRGRACNGDACSTHLS